MGAVLGVLMQNATGRLHLPYSSARIGQRPARRGGWLMSDAGQPLSQGRTLKALARGMYVRTQYLS